MNKFNFISKENIQSTTSNISVKNEEHLKEVLIDCQEFTLHFSSSPDSNVISEGRRIQPIIKSEIQDSLKRQIKSKIENILKTFEKISFFKMNQQTKLKLRMFLGYETDYTARNENKKVIGNVFGIPILLDDSLKDSIIVPVIKQVKQVKKTKFICLQ